MTTGRIESYLHSDSTTPNKGGVLLKVITQTDFAARGDALIAFARAAARHAYGAGSTVWSEIVDRFPEIETQRTALVAKLREQITVADIVIYKL